MDFSWSDDAQQQRNEVLEFVGTHLKFDVAANELSNEFPMENWLKCADQGILGWVLPKAYGGKELDILTTVYLLEAFGYACPDTSFGYALASQMFSTQVTLHKFASDEIKSNYLPRMNKGAIGAFAISEEEAGSDSYNLSTIAEKVEGGYILNGVKKFITFAPVAEFAVVFANANPERGQWGVTAFILDRGQEGFCASEVHPKMGMRSTPMGELTLNNCFVPEEKRIGAEGTGVSIFAKAMESERGYILATQLGVMERQLADTIQFVKKRRQGGKPISKYQAVADRVVDMKLRLENSRLLLHKVAWLESQGKPLLLEAALTNLQISEAYVASSLDAIRNHGVRGYLSEYGVERDLRDSVGGLIYSGTTDIQRGIVARSLGL